LGCYSRIENERRPKSEGQLGESALFLRPGYLYFGRINAQCLGKPPNCSPSTWSCPGSFEFPDSRPRNASSFGKILLTEKSSLA